LGGIYFSNIADYLNKQFSHLLTKEVSGNTLSVHVNKTVFPLFKTKLEKRCARFGIFDIDITSLLQAEEVIVQH
jgi:hypothetical protein